MRESLEVRIPISPRADYFHRIRLIAQSIRSLGGQYSDAKIRVTVGADEEPRDLSSELSWSRHLGVEWVWVDRAEFDAWKGTEHPYIATMMERFRPPFTTSTVLMLDADVIAVRPFDELIEYVHRGAGGIAGVMAHYSPFFKDPDEHERVWNELYEGFGIERPSILHELSGWPTGRGPRYSPPYYNTGVICAPAMVLERFHERYMKALQFVRSQLDSYFFEQIAMTLALDRTPFLIPPIPLRYNFPNQREFEAAYPEELRNVRFLHFLRTDTVSRERDFESEESILSFAARADLSGSNEILRHRVAELTDARA